MGYIFMFMLCIIILNLALWRLRAKGQGKAETLSRESTGQPEKEMERDTASVSREDIAKDETERENSLVMEITGDGERVNHRCHSSGSRRLRWISRERDDKGEPCVVRVPEESNVTFPSRIGIKAAGRSYTSLDQLTAKQVGDSEYRDVYGRMVVTAAERFPTFDSYDRLYETRHYRWWFIIEDGRLTRVYAEDDWNEVWVTEDVLDLESRQAELLAKLGYI